MKEWADPQQKLVEKLIAHLDLVMEKDYEKVLLAHIQDYQSLYNRVSLQLKEENSIEVTSFQASTKSSKDIVQNSLKRGYTPEQAVAVTKAQDAYKKSAVLTTDPTGVLSTCAYKVA